MTYLSERMPDEFFQIVKYIQGREDNYKISLTLAARELIIVPIAEYFIDESNLRNQIQERYGQEEVRTIRDSIDRIFKYMDLEPSEVDLNRTKDTTNGQYKVRSATSVIKGFSARFCSIPPFCIGTVDNDGESGL